MRDSFMAIDCREATDVHCADIIRVHCAQLVELKSSCGFSGETIGTKNTRNFPNKDDNDKTKKTILPKHYRLILQQVDATIQKGGRANLHGHVHVGDAEAGGILELRPIPVSVVGAPMAA